MLLSEAVFLLRSFDWYFRFLFIHFSHVLMITTETLNIKITMSRTQIRIVATEKSKMDKQLILVFSILRKLGFIIHHRQASFSIKNTVTRS